ncbi:MvaI/BcnI family restriction endonuclease [Roseibium sp. HPY-6]|uniref:MvaI/BcnI family restriction endonuclease n=1 Tax=Roseibium sp. HPY-6 TaxID=3229852 RepID=UPI00338DA11C
MIDTLSGLIKLFQEHGAIRFYAKKLAPNDNSKNQVYLGSDFSALNIIPHQGVYTDADDVAGSKRDRAKAAVSFAWVNENGRFEAPNAQLILYPDYPEVRMSGFLKGCKEAPGDIMRVRDTGRVLFLGISPSGHVIGHAVGPDHSLAREIHERKDLHQTGVFLELLAEPEAGDTRERLLETLTRIYRKHWIPSQKLGADGFSHPYRARNGGGYTLEAELGISPNGYAEPDFLGWEIKQYGVSDFKSFRPKSPVTLMTPGPTGGFYRESGVTGFMRRYAYADKSGRSDRYNFGGVYACDRGYHAETGLQLRMIGYDVDTSKITDMTGGIALQDRNGEVAALWQFTGIIDHWNRKHAQAAYVPSLFRTPPPEYHYGPRILLCERTDLTLFLKAIADGAVYYDPAIKIEDASTDTPAIKRRSQFRIRHDQLTRMYHQSEIVELAV